MALEVKRQFKETSQGLIHRFSKSIRGSGILLRAREIRFRKRKRSHYAKKSAALRKQELKKKYEKLKKLGKLGR
ncbi:MAG TPA: hypothetical protein ENI19_01900 [Candidatus Nealsonbacteria bacterium]|uniref:30S ribosomal protein S21 n=1 Tax=marine sediment metagenome TaxID=412755 RepID=A0A0F9UP93_9ZZZZ|nr:hypothetical protein [Candidatus Nealsonbacteria bacterium]HEB46444.1 hypothetical protein [Candidatus Nealsonbacteria bacterium]